MVASKGAREPSVRRHQILIRQPTCQRISALQQHRAELEHGYLYAVIGSVCEGRDTIVNTRIVRPAHPRLPPDLTLALACLCRQQVRDVPTDHARRAFRHVHRWQCRTHRICNVSSCMCWRLRSMRGCHGRNLFRAVLCCLSARLCGSFANPNAITKPTCMQAAGVQFKLDLTCWTWHDLA